MGGAWLDYNEMTERLELFYLKRTRREIMDRSWTACMEHDQLKASQLMDASNQQHSALADLARNAAGKEVPQEGVMKKYKKYSNRPPKAQARARVRARGK